ncbi:membrane anchor subunit of succinate dehydrogenase, Sdh4 [Arachnomyces sp. PD_36]|nr:membrane anchor subunit of succinate dehydrogenase, Sdh4 [Arachnomyces sp. PD_36]
MASFMRPSASAFRQTCLRSLATPAQRTAFYSTKSSQFGVAVAASKLRPSQSAIAGKVSGFHTTGKKQLLPAQPQVVEGTTNDAARVPPTSPTHGSYHWTFERIICAALIPLTVAPFAGGSLNPIMDAVLCGTIVVHSHIGFQAFIIDYIPTWRIPKVRAFFKWLLRAATLTVSVGLYEFETNDVGLTEAIKRIWKA